LRFAKLQIAESLGDDITKERLNAAYNIILDFNKPRSFTGKENILITMDKNFTKTLYAFGENGIHNAHNFSIFEYRTAIELLKERNDKFKEQSDKMKQK
jgi:hypothetical protein